MFTTSDASFFQQEVIQQPKGKTGRQTALQRYVQGALSTLGLVLLHKVMSSLQAESTSNQIRDFHGCQDSTNQTNKTWLATAIYVLDKLTSATVVGYLPSL